MILQRRGSTACVRRSRHSFAEPPAEAPSTRNNSRYWGSRSEHSASFAASPSSSMPFLRVSSRALRAASRAWAARTHLSTILRAVAGSSSKASASLSLTICWTRPLMSLLPSLALVCPSNWGSGSRTQTTAGSPSRTSSPGVVPFEVLVQERQLAQAIAQGVEGEGRLLEDLGIRIEADDRSGFLRRPGRRERAGGDAALVTLGPLLLVPGDLDLEPLAERVHDRDADAVQTAGDLVGGVLELPAG